MPIATNKGTPPFPNRNWFFGDSTTAGLAKADASAGQVTYLQGWPQWLPTASRGYNGAVPGHYTWEVENDLFGTRPSPLARAAVAGGETGPQPNQAGTLRKPDRLIIMTGINDAINFHSIWPSATTTVAQANLVFWHASLIYQLLQQGFVPYTSSRSVGDGIHDFLIMTMLPATAAAQFANPGQAANIQTIRAGANAAFITQFGEIANSISGSSGTNGANGVDGSGGAYVQNPDSYTHITLDCSAKKCMINVDSVLQGSASAGYMDTKYNNAATDGTFGCHLNWLGESTLAAAMAPYVL